MADETKGKKRKGRPTKAAAAAATSKQRTLKDMFGGGSKTTKQEHPVQEIPEVVIELSDSGPEMTTLPSTPAETGESNVVSRASSLSTLNGDEGLAGMVLDPPLPPMKLFPIFQKKLKDVKPMEELINSVPPDTSADQDVTGNTAITDPSIVPQRTRSPSIFIVPGPTNNLVQEGSSRDIPIVIESMSPAPELPKPVARPAKPVYSIFNRHSRATTSGPSKLTANLPAAVPSRDTQPENDWSSSPVVPPRFPSRDKGKAREVESPEQKLPPQLCSSTGDISIPQPITPIPIQHAIDIHDYITTIPPSHQTIPSISRLFQASAEVDVQAHPSCEQWTDRWRPRRADQVLGNEQHALHLLDWLQALRLQGESMRPAEPIVAKKNGRTKKRKVGKNKKPDIVRHVKKRRRDDFEDDFLEPDDFTEDEDDYAFDTQSSDWDDFGFCREMDAKINGSTNVSRGSSPLSIIDEDNPPISYKPTRFGRQISNTILLAGPSGSGKTAAVYACAEELGWEVFEVYPGTGERSGTELNKLIGDVGKNHTVKMHQSPKKPSAKTAFFQKQPERTMRRARRIVDSDDELDLLGRINDAGESAEDAALEVVVSEPVVNQSVILIEEADVLYQTDTNFWPALINIIKSCRRPVVLTCNDVSLIPRDILPLQATLEFRPCSPHLAASYLQALCLAEQRQVARDNITRLLQQHPNDLRHAIQHLQLWLESKNSGAPEQTAAHSLGIDVNVPGSHRGSSPLIYPMDTSSPGPASLSHEDGDKEEQARLLRSVGRRWEALSYADSCLSRDSRQTFGNYFTDECLPNADDELGYIVLYSDIDTDHIPVSSFYQQDQHMLYEITNQHEDAIPLPHPETLEPDLQDYIAGVRSILYSSKLARGPLSETSLFLEYAPWVRCMAEFEEAQRAALALEESTQRRRTRNSQKSEPQNWLSLDVEARQALLATGFVSKI